MVTYKIICEACSGKPVFGGAAMTAWSCKVCGERGMSGSTAHPNICKKCALDEGVCQRCLRSLTEEELQSYLENEI